MIEKKCEYCGMIFQISPCRKNLAKYCSYKCSSIAKGKKRKGKSYEEIYGKEKAKSWKENQSKAAKGKKQSETHRLNNILSTREWHRKNRNTLEYKERYKRFGEKMRGHLTSKETRKKIGLSNSEKQNGIPKPYMRKIMKKKWQEKEYREKQVKLIINGLRIKPNKSEQVMIDIIKENNLPFNYVGDGKILIEGFNPDFICNPSKKIIELFGEYHHNLLKNKKRDKRRLNSYSKHGFQTLIIWSNELKNLPKVINKIKNFLEL